MAFDGARRNRHPGETVLGLHYQGLERLGKETRPALGRPGVHLQIDLFRVYADLQQVGGNSQGMRPSVAKPKTSGIGEQRDVEGAGDRLSQGPTVGAGNLEDQLTRG